MRGFMLAAVATCGLAFAACAQAQTDPAKGYHWPDLPWHDHQMTPDIYWVEGGGGNSAVLVGKTGVAVYDAKTTLDGGKQLLRHIAGITPLPVNTVLLSHSDVDHVGGLRAFPDGLRIIAQQNDLAELKQDLAANPSTALPADHFPTETFDKTRDLVVDGFTLRLVHWAPAHTSGDMVMYLPRQKIVFCGDIVTQNRPHPLIHLEKHGSSLGWIASIKGLLKLDAVQFVPGHGAVMTRADIEKMLAAAEAERAQVVAMVHAGKSLADIKAATGDPSAEEKAGPPFASFSEVVYDEVTGHAS